MNKKGFTLAELLAVIAILAVITTIAFVSLNGVRKKIDLNIVQSDLELAIVSAKSYGEDHLSSLPRTVSINDLSSEGLSIGDEYQDIKILVYLKNRRAAACISNLDNSIESIVGEENKCAFSSLYCPFYDFNNDGKFSNEDATHLLFHVSFPDDYPLTSYGGSIADINHDGIIDDDDAIVVSNYYSGISNGDNTISYSNPC